MPSCCNSNYLGPIISISNGFAGCKDSSIHHTSNNIANVSALVTRFIKICDRDWSLSLEPVKRLTEPQKESCDENSRSGT
ncbi:hypothetical protein B4900_01010 [Yersinia rohdei]|nr:hypothetical protein B4900_01010 [Yersinia rohdei]